MTLPELEILLNSSVREKDELRLSRQARLDELRRLEALPFSELTGAQCIIVHGSDYPLCPGAAPVADLFPEHGGGVPALYSDPSITPEQWPGVVEEIIKVSGPLPISLTDIVGPELPMSAQAGQLGSGAGLGLSILAILLL